MVSSATASRSALCSLGIAGRRSTSSDRARRCRTRRRRWPSRPRAANSARGAGPCAAICVSSKRQVTTSMATMKMSTADVPCRGHQQLVVEPITQQYGRGCDPASEASARAPRRWRVDTECSVSGHVLRCGPRRASAPPTGLQPPLQAQVHHGRQQRIVERVVGGAARQVEALADGLEAQVDVAARRHLRARASRSRAARPRSARLGSAAPISGRTYLLSMPTSNSRK